MLQSQMGNLLACAHSSSADAPHHADLETHSPGPEELLGLGDVSQLILNRSCSEEAKNPPNPYSDNPKGLGLTHLFRTASEEAEMQKAQSTGQKIKAFFKKDKNKKKKNYADGGDSSSSSSSPAKATPAKVVVDDRSRFGLAPLPLLSASKSRHLSSLCVRALLGELGAVTGIKSVKRAELERLAREAAAKLKEEEDAEAALLEKAKEADAAPVSASVVPVSPPAEAVVVDKDVVMGADAPVAPPMTLYASFAPSSSAVSQKPDKKLYWAKGTGYGHHGNESNWTMEAYMATLKQKQQQVQFICRKLSDRLVGKQAEKLSAAALAQTTLLPFLESYLRNDSMNEIFEQHAELYSDVFHLVAYLLAVDAPNASPYLELFEGKLAAFVKKIAKSAEMVERMESTDVDNNVAAASKPASASSSSVSSSSSSSSPASVFPITSVVIELNRTLESLLAAKALWEEETKKAVSAAEVAAVIASVSSSSSSSVAVAEPSTEREESVSISASSAASSQDKEESASAAPAKVESDKPSAEQLAEYAKVLSAHRFGEMEEFDYHKYKKQQGSNSSKSSAPISRAFTRRLAVEFADLNESLPIHYESSVWMRVHETQMQYAQMMISGPTGTPYESGLFLFDVFFGSQYPNSPPEVNLQTTGGGSVRFGPNLYNCGKVCLSLLGTWSGGAGEGWSAKNSTMLQVGVSIQSLIFVPEPFYNEPSYESMMHTKEGQQQSDAYSVPLLKATILHAMLQQMEKPPKGFEAVVSSHFALKKDAILKQMEQWKEKNAEIGELIPKLKAALEKQKVVV